MANQLTSRVSVRQHWLFFAAVLTVAVLGFTYITLRGGMLASAQGAFCPSKAICQTRNECQISPICAHGTCSALCAGNCAHS